jgi:hypothetical protein
MMDNTTRPTEPQDPFGILPETEVPRGDTYDPVSEADRAAYEADVAHILKHDRDGDGDVDLLDAALAGLSKIKDLFGVSGGAADEIHTEPPHDAPPAA